MSVKKSLFFVLMVMFISRVSLFRNMSSKEREVVPFQKHAFYSLLARGNHYVGENLSQNSGRAHNLSRGSGQFLKLAKVLE